MSFIDTLMEFVLEYNLSLLMFVLYSVIISCSGVVVNLSKHIPVPDYFLQAFKYGKMAHKSKPWRIISFMEVPKRWFLHFYITASVVVTVAALQMWDMYMRQQSLSNWISSLLDILTIPDREPAVSGTTAVISLTLFALHVYRRLYENLFVSVFSSSYMNILHYIVGITHYIASVMVLISHLPGFDGRVGRVHFPSVELPHAIGIVVYLFGFIVQHHSLRLLAGLRKEPGKDAKNKHKMPKGGMFEVVSCPHMMAEVMVYLGILIVLQRHTGWLIVTVWVICNQIQVAIMNHKWYQDTFKDYPLHRRAIIPFLL